MIAVIAVILAALVPLQTHADRVGQGAGISENNIAYAYEYADLYLTLCLASNDCLETDEQKNIAGKILAALPMERKVAGQIQFRPQRSDGFFMIDGKMR